MRGSDAWVSLQWNAFTSLMSFTYWYFVQPDWSLPFPISEHFLTLFPANATPSFTLPAYSQRVWLPLQAFQVEVAFPLTPHVPLGLEVGCASSLFLIAPPRPLPCSHSWNLQLLWTHTIRLCYPLLMAAMSNPWIIPWIFNVWPSVSLHYCSYKLAIFIVP